MVSDFDRDTIAEAQGDGLYKAEISGNWSVGGKPNGGYLTALIARTAGDTLAHPDPLSITAHFLRAPTPGPASLDVEMIRSGRAHANVAAGLHQDDGECVRMLGVFGNLAAVDGPTAVDAQPVELAPLEQCVPAQGTLPGGVEVTLTRQFDSRYDPRTIGWARGEPSGRAHIGAWVRFADGREPDLWSLLLVVDALPPTVFDLGLSGWVPTLELTTHLRARPAAGWLRVWVRTRFLIGGYLEEDAEVWDSEDKLVAMSRQLAIVPRGG
ncbi:MAG: thioesterase family protein [Nitriliruptorales bacterium]|nr:thioesterase family protein [Nitriliruptorales bacterium]